MSLRTSKLAKRISHDILVISPNSSVDVSCTDRVRELRGISLHGAVALDAGAAAPRAPNLLKSTLSRRQQRGAIPPRLTSPPTRAETERLEKKLVLRGSAEEALA